MSVKVQSHYVTAYANVCSYAHMYTLALADIRLEYVVYVPNTLTYVGIRCVDEFAEANIFLDMFKFISVCERITYVTHTLTIRTACHIR